MTLRLEHAHVRPPAVDALSSEVAGGVGFFAVDGGAEVAHEFFDLCVALLISLISENGGCH